MKTKLLKIIRKRFEIYHYPNRKKQFVISDSKDHTYDSLDWHGISISHTSKQSAIDAIIHYCSIKYRKFTRKHKMSLVKKKVWHL